MTIALSERQISVLRLVAMGKPNKIIAYELGRDSDSAIKSSVSEIMKKTTCTNRNQLILLYLSSLPPDECLSFIQEHKTGKIK